MKIKICKSDSEKRLVFGFASVSIKNGVPIVDADGDTISIEELEKAAYRFVEMQGGGGEMHDPDRGRVAHLVESFVLTPEKAESMGMLTETFGWWVGFKVDSDAVWAKIKSGEYSMLSIGVKARRVSNE